MAEVVRIEKGLLNGNVNHIPSYLPQKKSQNRDSWITSLVYTVFHDHNYSSCS